MDASPEGSYTSEYGEEAETIGSLAFCFERFFPDVAW